MNTVEEFVNKIMLRFPPTLNNGDTLEDYIIEYIKSINTNELFNYDDAFIDLWRSYSFKTTPPPKMVLEILKQHKIKIDIPPETEPETLIVRKGKYDYEYGVQLSNYAKDIEYFQKNGFNIIKLKWCDKNCQRCNYNHVCNTAQELRA